MIKAVAIYCTGTSNQSFSTILTRLINAFERVEAKVYLNSEGEPFLEPCMQKKVEFFYDTRSCISDIDFIISLGGDGTFLKAADSFAKCKTPIVGINAGRLGFLADIKESEIEKMVKALDDGDYDVEERMLLELHSENGSEVNQKVALNEITVQKTHSSHFLNIHTYIDGEYLTTYWSDGLVVATPTGSTAYSLSLGGPVLNPRTKALVLNPMAPHSLTARPMVVPDDSQICVLVEGRQDEFLVSMDSHSYIFKVGERLIIKKSEYTIPIVKLPDKHFYDVLRKKMMWGADSRN